MESPSKGPQSSALERHIRPRDKETDALDILPLDTPLN